MADFRLKFDAPEVCPFGITAEDFPSPTIPQQPCQGPGTELKRILAQLGIDEMAGCSCNATMQKMNEWGPDGCEVNIDWIISQMTAEADKRGWMRFVPFKELGAELIVCRAIAAARAT